MRYSVTYTPVDSKEAELLEGDPLTLDAAKAIARRHSPTPITWRDTLGYGSLGTADHGQYRVTKTEHGVAVTDLPTDMLR